MSYTILTIPFNLKEKQEGDYLEKGFVIDDVLPEFFDGNDGTNPIVVFEGEEELDLDTVPATAASGWLGSD
jgi:hypothetical protein